MSRVGRAAEALRELLPIATARRLHPAGQIAIAPLFFYPILERPDPRGEMNFISENYFQRLEKVISTNRSMRLVRFPRAIRSLQESEMAVNGLVESDANAWEKVADVYIWGTYSQTMPDPKKPIRRISAILNSWDGRTAAKIAADGFTFDPRGLVPTVELNALVDRLIAKTIFLIQQVSSSGLASDTARQQVAESILQAALSMGGTGFNSFLPFPGEGGQFGQRVQMLETACF